MFETFIRDMLIVIGAGTVLFTLFSVVMIIAISWTHKRR